MDHYALANIANTLIAPPVSSGIINMPQQSLGYGIGSPPEMSAEQKKANEEEAARWREYQRKLALLQLRIMAAASAATACASGGSVTDTANEILSFIMQGVDS